MDQRSFKRMFDSLERDGLPEDFREHCLPIFGNMPWCRREDLNPHELTLTRPSTGCEALLTFNDDLARATVIALTHRLSILLRCTRLDVEIRLPLEDGEGQL
jgi:hypothetical protein